MSARKRPSLNQYSRDSAVPSKGISLAFRADRACVAVRESTAQPGPSLLPPMRSELLGHDALEVARVLDDGPPGGDLLPVSQSGAVFVE